MKRIFAGLCLLMAVSLANAQSASPGKYTWEEFSARIKVSQAISPLGPNVAGEQVSLSNGALSFSATDVSLPGNSGLPVAFSRSYSAVNRKDFGNLGMLADWTVDVPSINAAAAPNWVLGPTEATNRCSSSDFPALPAGSRFRLADFWQGVQISIPGIESDELIRTAASSSRPANGLTYHWMTNSQVHVSCLSSIKNGAGEGFLAVDSAGTKYWFDWMGQTPEPPSRSAYLRVINVDGTVSILQQTLNRKKNFLYATRVEDKLGNYVTYTYTNAWDAPGKLTQIQASDGRTITLNYNGDTVSSVSDGSRTWTYSYATGASGRKTLTGVALPDGSAWTLSLSALTDAEIKYNEYPPTGEILRTCLVNEQPINYDATFVGSIRHPAGALATFTLDIREHGRSYVPVACRNVVVQNPNLGGLDNDPNDDVNLYATSAYSLTLKQKSISGTGIATDVWNYAYIPNTSVYFYPGTTRNYPVCDQANYDCSQPPCTSEACARSSVTEVSGPNGEWSRYFHGNTYLYNEGKLLKVESGTSASNILERVTHTYDLGRTSPPASFGVSHRMDGDGFSATFPRPLTKTTRDRQGVRFAYQVDALDALHRPTRVTRASSVAPADPPPDPSAVPPVVPAVPVLSGPSSAASGAIFTLTWTSVANATHYVLERSAGGTPWVVYTGAGNSYSTQGRGTPSFRIKACNNTVCSASSAYKTVTITGGGGPGGGGAQP
ncbi:MULTISPECIES: hypothetical protein [unclassified Pseudoxanthomonas]|uniref:hypothetical protein n=1 Tax=unclassified Pseudoxanthomonas TaxID=2645906 RepID=UPI0008F2F366|nr:MULTISPECIES: hypothetical protein [unclassified Pseudoxanthomonas]PPJ41946.1 hypothetical protein C0063_01140 [Pseudoxanthomonas sp. KAs_5_3]SFV29107.1 hypothetical protein SAMN05428990_1207 [Pseudoxanthomonas sp. YR558]